MKQAASSPKIMFQPKPGFCFFPALNLLPKQLISMQKLSFEANHLRAKLAGSPNIMRSELKSNIFKMLLHTTNRLISKTIVYLHTTYSIRLMTNGKYDQPRKYLFKVPFKSCSIFYKIKDVIGIDHSRIFRSMFLCTMKRHYEL